LLLSWVRPVVAASFLFLLAIWASRPYVSGDTPFVLDGTNALIDCLSRHDFHACGFTGHLNPWHLMSPIGDWPLLQHVPDLISISLGATSHPDRVDVLVGLNIAAVLISVILGRVVLSRAGQAGWFWGFLLVVLSGPILAYANQSAGEALASGLVARVVAKEAWLDEAKRVARDIASKGPVATRLAKEAVDRAYESTLQLGLEYERRALYLAFASEDAREGLTAFTEKRKPGFKGR